MSEPTQLPPLRSPLILIAARPSLASRLLSMALCVVFTEAMRCERSGLHRAAFRLEARLAAMGKWRPCPELQHWSVRPREWAATNTPQILDPPWHMARAFQASEYSEPYTEGSPWPQRRS